MESIRCRTHSAMEATLRATGLWKYRAASKRGALKEMSRLRGGAFGLLHLRQARLAGRPCVFFFFCFFCSPLLASQRVGKGVGQPCEVARTR